MLLYGISFFCSIVLMHAAPLSRCIVDMTHTFDETTLHYPGTKAFQLDVIKNGSWGTFDWVQFEEYRSSIHMGTHMDAPAHFSLGGLTADQIPLSNLIVPAAVVDITEKCSQDRDANITTEDLQNWETTTGHSLNSTVLLLRTGWGAKWRNQTDYFGTPEDDASKHHFPGLTGEAAQWLVAHRSILGMGVETVSLDKGNDLLFPVHLVLLASGIYGLENVANMDKLPLYGAMLYVMPMKVGGGSGAPTRIFATFPEILGAPQRL